MAAYSHDPLSARIFERGQVSTKPGLVEDPHPQKPQGACKRPKKKPARSKRQALSRDATLGVYSYRFEISCPETNRKGIVYTKSEREARRVGASYFVLPRVRVAVRLLGAIVWDELGRQRHVTYDETRDGGRVVKDLP